MSVRGQTEKSDRPPSRSVLPPQPDIDAKQPAVAYGARPVDEFNPNRGRSKEQSHPCRSLKLGPSGACLLRASLFLFQRTSHKRLVLMRFLRSLGNEKRAGLQDHTALPSASAPFVSAPFDRSRVWLNPKPALQFTCSPDAAASTASRPASLTIRIRPSVGRDGEGYRFESGAAKTEIFLQRGLDR